MMSYTGTPFHAKQKDMAFAYACHTFLKKYAAIVPYETCYVK